MDEFYRTQELNCHSERSQIRMHVSMASIGFNSMIPCAPSRMVYQMIVRNSRLSLHLGNLIGVKFPSPGIQVPPNRS
jgi:hypothetical protein